MNNKFNNDSLPFGSKIVAMNIPEDIENIEEALTVIIKACVNLYGIIIGIFKKNRFLIQLNKNVPEHIMMEAKRLQTVDNISDELDIIPFPKI
jgi:hypothetical protein